MVKKILVLLLLISQLSSLYPSVTVVNKTDDIIYLSYTYYSVNSPDKPVWVTIPLIKPGQTRINYADACMQKYWIVAYKAGKRQRDPNIEKGRTTFGNFGDIKVEVTYADPKKDKYNLKVDVVNACFNLS